MECYCAILPRHFANSYRLHKYQVTNEGCVDEVEGIMPVRRLRN